MSNKSLNLLGKKHEFFKTCQCLPNGSSLLRKRVRSYVERHCYFPVNSRVHEVAISVRVGVGTRLIKENLTIGDLG